MTRFFIILFFPLFVQSQPVNWQLQEQYYDAGDTIAAQFTVYDFDSVTAYQIAMKFDTGAIKFLGVSFPAANPLGLDAGDFGFYQVNKGILRHLWSNIYSSSLTDGTPIFSYNFVAKQSGTLSADLWLSTCCINPPMNPMAYRYPLKYNLLTLTYSGQGQLLDASEPQMQAKIYPNPTTGAITVETDNPVTIEVYNYMGELTHCTNTAQTTHFLGVSKGVNVVIITGDNGRSYAKMIIKE